ncbi:PREDICTED: probable lysophospholipase BODYGUARD 4 [Nelumbo nucifera]|uniref:AB hydrolase-1 domain-containing protein n=2 Tax=Nelumbo nucifera TaxID=4432 RepID=A0A822YDR1_NELNU|nr:PREDICTED: probable lysophospholipase BODYGUARD 4 [Nelumbo nucifera]DAD29196.1 TPA_asm: hypothetical protein HUJ06_030664 [Nelumbo nucifera]
MISSGWSEKIVRSIVSIVDLVVFTLLDFLDFILCFVYRFLDESIEVNPPSCYCQNRGKQGVSVIGDGEDELSETLYGRKNIFRDCGLHRLGKRADDSAKSGSLRANRWSDCNCESCVSWQQNGDKNLHVFVMEPSQAINENCKGILAENVIFLHGFLSSSSIWTETVFTSLSESVKRNYKLFAVDLLGFGRSPKPQDCLYTLKDHMEMIEKSVIESSQLNSFHLVAHSMGCIIALGLAAKYAKSVKSVILVAPPYFISTKEEASLNALHRLAERRIWPLLHFGSSLMSWYEHLGRTVCFIICRNHRIWECMLKLLTWRRELPFTIIDFTRHTHHSAWHTMHNVICGGAKLMDEYLETLRKSGVSLAVIQGDKDQVVPLECSNNIKQKYPLAAVKIINGSDHSTVILGREKDFTRDLEELWCYFCRNSLRRRR